MAGRYARNTYVSADRSQVELNDPESFSSFLGICDTKEEALQVVSKIAGEIIDVLPKKKENK